MHRVQQPVLVGGRRPLDDGEVMNLEVNILLGIIQDRDFREESVAVGVRLDDSDKGITQVQSVAAQAYSGIVTGAGENCKGRRCRLPDRNHER